MLRIDLRELDRGPVVTRTTLPVDDPVVKELDVKLSRPLEVEGKLQETGPDEYFWQGRLHGLARGQCRRCLAELELPIDAEVGALFSSNPESEDDPSVYPLGSIVLLRPTRAFPGGDGTPARVAVAMDTGAAIKLAGRIDVYFGDEPAPRFSRAFSRGRPATFVLPGL